MDVTIIAHSQNQVGMTTAGITVSRAEKMKTVSAMLSSFAPKLLCCRMDLAIGPSTMSLMPQYRYTAQKGREKGAVNMSTIAPAIRVAVIRLAKFLIKITSMTARLYDLIHHLKAEGLRCHVTAQALFFYLTWFLRKAK